MVSREVNFSSAEGLDNLRLEQKVHFKGRPMEGEPGTGSFPVSTPQSRFHVICRVETGNETRASLFAMESLSVLSLAVC